MSPHFQILIFMNLFKEIFSGNFLSFLYIYIYIPKSYDFHHQNTQPAPFPLFSLIHVALAKHYNCFESREFISFVLVLLIKTIFWWPKCLNPKP